MITRLVGLVFAVAGTVVALAPAVVALRRGSWLIWIAAVIALFYAGAFWRVSAMRQPLAAKGLLVALGISAFGPAISGFLLMVFALGGWALEALAEWVWRWFSVPPVLPSGVFDWLVLAALLLVSPMVVVAMTTQAEWLGRPPEERADAIARLRQEHGARWWTRPVTGAVMSLGVAGTYASGLIDRVSFVPFLPSLLVGTALEVALIFLCSAAWQAAQLARRRTRAESAVESVEKLLSLEGFAVERSVREASDDGAPSVRNIDLVARRGSDILAVEVKTGADGHPIDWTVASSLGLAASILAMREKVATTAVRPLLVLVEAHADPSLDRARRAERVGVLNLSAAELQAAAGGADTAREAVVSRLQAALAGAEAQSS